MPVELSFNGEATEFAMTSSGASFTFYNDVLFNVASIVPLGGPAAGGTHVTVALGDGYEPLSPLADLGGYLHGPHCRFTHASGWQHTVTASLSAGGEALLCDSPAFTGRRTGPSRRHTLRMDGDLKVGYVGPEIDTSHPVYLEVTLTRHQYTRTNQTFRFYDERDWRLMSITPQGGPVSGGTVVVVGVSPSVRSLAGALCHFGDARPVPAIIELDGGGNVKLNVDGSLRVSCASPRAWRRQAKNDESIELTLSVDGGQDYLRGQPHALIFSYINVQPVAGLGTHWLTPSGGPAVGGTLVQVRGARLSNLGGLICKFHALAPPTPATWVDFHHVKCVSPKLHESHEPWVNESQVNSSLHVTINGALEDLSAYGTPFLFYCPAALRVASIYPRGGPVAGGALVSVRGAGFVDLDHGSGLKCRFGDHPLVPATLVSAQELTCLSPPLKLSGDSAETVIVRVTNNGDPYAATNDMVGFTYYVFD